jgi:hypothetical protein
VGSESQSSLAPAWDKNSKFFHYKASQRNRKNKINFITNQQGNRATDNKEIQSAFMDYFTGIFS